MFSPCRYIVATITISLNLVALIALSGNSIEGYNMKNETTSQRVINVLFSPLIYVSSSSFAVFGILKLQRGLRM